MRRKLNFKLLAIVSAVLLLAGIATHFLHAYQVRQNAYRLLERGDKAIADKDYDKALTFFGQYLGIVPDDVDTVQKYAEALDARANDDDDHITLILKMEQVLRAKPAENALRLRLVHNLVAMDRVPEAIGHLQKLKDVWQDKAEIQHLLGMCLESQKQYPQAVSAFEAAIRSNAKSVASYALLAGVLQDRLNQPDEAVKVMDDLVKANGDNFRAYLLRSRFLRRRGDDKAADADLQMAFKLGADQPGVILEFAEAERARGKWEEAAKLLADAMKRFPGNTDFLKAIVNVELQTGKTKAALDHLRAGVERAPGSHELAVLMIDLLIDQKQYAEARTRMEELAKARLKPTMPNYLKARLAVVDKDYRTAIHLLEGVRSDLSPGSDWLGRVQVLLGACYRVIGDHEQELQAYRQAVRDEPTWVAASVGLGAALIANGLIEEACQALEPLRSAKELPAGYWILLARARLYRQMNLPAADRRWDDVESALQQAALAKADDAEVPIVRAELQSAQGDFAGAQKTLEQARAEHPESVEVWCGLASLEARQNHIERAEQILTEASAKLGDNVEIRLARARLWGALATPAALVKLASLDQALPQSVSIEQRARLYRELGDTWHRLDNWDRAEKCWREVAGSLPKDARSRFALMELAVQKNQYTRARELRDELRQIEGDQGWLWRYADAAILVQQAHGRRGLLDDARKKLAELEQVHKNWPRNALLRARIFELEGKAQPAIEEYTRALDMGEMPPASMSRLLDLLVTHRDFTRAETELAKYQEKAPLTRDLARLGAEAALGLRDARFTKLAVGRAEQAVALPIKDYRDGIWLARVYQAAGETAKAEKMLQTCLDQARETPEVWIAWLSFLARTKQRGRAAHEIDKMNQALPNRRQALTLARGYEASQQLDQAAKAYEDALAKNPDDIALLTHAADFYRRADRTEAAEKLYRRLLDPAVGTMADDAMPARRRLAVLLAPRDAKLALALLDQNKRVNGESVADQRVRWFIESLTLANRQRAIARFDDSLRQQIPTPDERVLYARMLESAGTLGAARDQLAEALDESGYAPQFVAAFARLLIRAGDLDEARRQLTRLEAAEPTSERTAAVRAALAEAVKQGNETRP
ncbi:MAG TPA: tetratricopeptide repeat protein [Gemmataceae bacterium]|nr:tetratricopeptide repeat protein [Gemmataceae bacterium]